MGIIFKTIIMERGTASQWNIHGHRSGKNQEREICESQPCEEEPCDPPNELKK